MRFQEKTPRADPFSLLFNVVLILSYQQPTVSFINHTVPQFQFHADRYLNPLSSLLFPASHKMARVGVSDKSRLICAALSAADQSVDHMLNAMHQAKVQGADLVEIQLECIADSDLKFLLEKKPIPVVLVSRPKWEGGKCKSNEQEHLQSLLLAKDLGADYIDLELKVASALIKEDKFHHLKSSKIIVSTYLDSFTALLLYWKIAAFLLQRLNPPRQMSLSLFGKQLTLQK